MKNYLIICLLLLTGATFAQSVEPNYTIEGNLVKATYFYDNGKVSQEGYYKDGKVHGQWTSYSENGIKLSTGLFAEGVKTGQWTFWNQNSQNQVVYANNKVIETNKIKTEALVQMN